MGKWESPKFLDQLLISDYSYLKNARVRFGTLRYGHGVKFGRPTVLRINLIVASLQIIKDILNVSV